ncbi:hypothetical protein AMR72_08445 [Flavobacterium psychrophilum]|nr:hypothetical protein AMR72_08445 [Flavobacterium psychrophilum]AOE52530.1 hypothetical protein ALW18_08435 [Flavobacterium psychrophilum]
MKKIIKLLAAFVAMATVVACEPVEDRESLPAVTLKPSDININVTTNGNVVTMTNTTEGITPYWSYVDAKGNDLGHSNQNQNQVTLPFAGKYNINFTAFTRGGRVDAAPVEVTIAENDEEFFSAEEWGWLTNGADGKTWVLDMESPVGWANPGYPETTEDHWYPDYAGNSWVMENKNWGEMTFDLDGGYNMSVTQTALTGNAQTTKTGTFNYNLEGKTMNFSGGAELLYGGNYYLDVSNWKSVRVLEISENSMRLSVMRDQSRSGEGLWQIVFHFKPKQ